MALWILTPVMLMAGNSAIPEVVGRDFTPFEVAGPPFFVAVLPTTAILALRRKWMASGVTLGLFHAAMGLLLLAWLGVPACFSWVLPVTGVGMVVTQASRARVPA